MPFLLPFWANFYGFFSLSVLFVLMAWLTYFSHSAIFSAHFSPSRADEVIPPA